MKTLRLGSWLEVSVMRCKYELGFGAVAFLGRGNLDMGLLFGPFDLNVEIWWPTHETTEEGL